HRRPATRLADRCSPRIALHRPGRRARRPRRRLQGEGPHRPHRHRRRGRRRIAAPPTPHNPTPSRSKAITDTWEEIEIPQGTFIGWGEIGQTITGKVLSFAAEGGSDFNGNPCPQVVLELTETVDNYKDKGTTKETLDAGELVTLTCGQANLKR